MNPVTTMFALIFGSALRSSILHPANIPSSRYLVHAYITTITKQRSVVQLVRGTKSSVTYLSPFGCDHRLAGPSSMQLFSTLSTSEIDELNARIKSKGDEIRLMKESGTVTKEELAPYVAELKLLKSQLPTATETVVNDDKKTDEAKGKAAVKNTSKKAPPVAAVEELSETELRLTRVTKIDTMRNAGVEPYEYTFTRTHTADQLQNEYQDQLQNGEEDTSMNVSMAGRIMTRRVFGKLAFFTLQDSTGTIQLQFDQSRLNDSFQVCVVTTIS